MMDACLVGVGGVVCGAVGFVIGRWTSGDAAPSDNRGDLRIRSSELLSRPSGLFTPRESMHALEGIAKDHLRKTEYAKRVLLPNRIILIRHGESEGNVHESVYGTKADNLVELSELGSSQAISAGKHLKAILGDEKIIVFVSPFQRAYQTLRNIRTHLEDNIVSTEIEPVLREQEFGNLQGEEYKRYKQERMKVGRFYYRFPTGESGADVYHRVNLFWEDIWKLNVVGDPVDNVLVVTHGLTIRLLLMQLFKWSPDTFETMYNPANCEFFVLKKKMNMHLADQSRSLPYELDYKEGAAPKSERKVKVTFKGAAAPQNLLLKDYLSLPQPRTRSTDAAARMLVEQYGDFSVNDIVGVDFFVDEKFAKYR